MPKKDKMLIVRKNIALESDQEFVFNACRRSIRTDSDYYIVPLVRCFGGNEGNTKWELCDQLCPWKSPEKNSKDRKVIYCMSYCAQPE